MLRKFKSILSYLDKILIGSYIKKSRIQSKENKLINYKSNIYQHGFVTEYIKSSSLLNILCDKYGSDKGEVTDENNPYTWPSHNYADAYELMFRLRRQDVKLLVECGLGTNNPALISSMGIHGKPGASLRIWRDYFPNANIIGIDIDPDTLFTDERITTYQVDQTCGESIKNFCEKAEIKNSSIDVIIDDGLHEYHAGIALFESMEKYLAEDGIYVIEDVIEADYFLYKDYFNDVKDKFSTHFINLHRPSSASVRDNRLIVIRRV